MAELKKATQEVKESLEVDESFREMKKDLEDSVSGLNEPLDAFGMNKWEEKNLETQGEEGKKSEETLAPPEAQEKAAETEAKKNGKG
jgi:hypothetical protein